VLGEPAEFRFLASSLRRDDQAGTMVDEIDERLQELAPVSTVLEGEGAGQLVPVKLRSRVTEIGTLELWCVEVGGNRRWKLEYNLRESPP
jgi:hypothetical protein